MNSLLPPNATPLERAIEQTLREPYERALSVAGAKWNAALRPALHANLVHEWGLAALEPYLPREHILNDGVAWSRIRGTVAAVELALGWIGIDAPYVEEDGPTAHFHQMQLDPDRIPAPVDIPHIRRLSKLSLPARASLYRIYHGHDLRPLQLDRSRLDDALLDDDSGVFREGVKLSFGSRAAAALPIEDPPTASGMTRTYSTRVWDDNSWRMDAWALDSEILIDAAGGVVAQLSAVAPFDDTPANVTRFDRYVFVGAISAEEPAVNGRTDAAATALQSETRTWSGSWAGAWREPIPHRTTFEGA